MTELVNRVWEIIDVRFALLRGMQQNEWTHSVHTQTHTDTHECLWNQFIIRDVPCDACHKWLHQQRGNKSIRNCCNVSSVCRFDPFDHLLSVLPTGFGFAKRTAN